MRSRADICGQVLDDAHDQSAHHCADNQVKATEDDDGKNFEPDDGKLVVPPIIAPHTRPASAETTPASAQAKAK